MLKNDYVFTIHVSLVMELKNEAFTAKMKVTVYLLNHNKMQQIDLFYLRPFSPRKMLTCPLPLIGLGFGTRIYNRNEDEFRLNDI